MVGAKMSVVVHMLEVEAFGKAAGNTRFGSSGGIHRWDALVRHVAGSVWTPVNLTEASGNSRWEGMAADSWRTELPSRRWVLEIILVVMNLTDKDSGREWQ